MTGRKNEKPEAKHGMLKMSALKKQTDWCIRISEAVLFEEQEVWGIVTSLLPE